ncbi:MAG: acyl-CoA dehydrogenase family protein [Betaproteobacteria bacterium]|nr:acyl-CoA dehydrogenase family protein [Betaproteobacteria bacterium]
MKVFERLDATLKLPQEEAMLVESVRQLAHEKIAPRAEHYDRSGEFPHANVEAINELGLNAMFIPAAYGGAQLSYAAYLACVREISGACASTGVIWATNFHAVKPLIDFGTEEQKKRLLPVMLGGGLAALTITEPTAGSDATGMKAPGLKVVREEDKMGLRASSTAALAFDNCRVPRANLLGKPGEGLKILLASLNRSRPSVAAHALGIARAAFEDAVAYINERRQSGRKIIEFQGIQFMLADMATDLAMCEAWLWHVARMVDGGAADFGVEASMLKLRASDLAMRIATDAVQLHGGYGYCKDYRVERLMRDAKITQIWEGTNQIHRQFIGRSFIRK